MLYKTYVILIGIQLLLDSRFIILKFKVGILVRQTVFVILCIY